MRLSIACEKRKDELKNFLSKYGCQKATKNREILEIRCLSRLVKREKATEIEEIPEIRCLSRRQEVKKATKIEEIPKIRCPSQQLLRKLSLYRKKRKT